MFRLYSVGLVTLVALSFGALMLATLTLSRQLEGWVRLIALVPAFAIGVLVLRALMRRELAQVIAMCIACMLAWAVVVHWSEPLHDLVRGIWQLTRS